MKRTIWIPVVAAAVAVAAATAFFDAGTDAPAPYEEAPDPAPGLAADWAAAPDLAVGFAGCDERSPKGLPLGFEPEPTWRTSAWRGERVHTRIVLATKQRLEHVTVEAGALTGSAGRIPASAVEVGRIRYVLTDGLSETGSGCGISPERQAAATLCEDAIDPQCAGAVEACTVRPFWLSVQVPQDVRPGVYEGYAVVHADGRKFELPYTVEVGERVLPAPSEWRFHLDLWQNPYSVARYYGVPAWSEEHFERMKPYMELLARAGQKVVTVSMIYDPWRGQTYDIYDSMIRWVKHADGSWSYDYGVFDRWVGFMEELGIDGSIDCYTMVPWNNRFYYYDEAAGCDAVLEAATGTPEFEEHWEPMLRDFARHLRATGRFAKTAIAMDERPLADMQSVIRLVKRVEPEFRIALAGNYHAEIEADICDYSIALADRFPPEVLAARRQAGRPATFYTCCMEGAPNTFTFSPPAEAAWMGWHAAARGYAGYLRWAYNCWPEDPLRDSRFGTWSGGDTYLIYPGPRSSVRFERLIEGIQDYEKTNLLMEEFAREGRSGELLPLLGALEAFDAETLRREGAAGAVNRAKSILAQYGDL